MKKRKILLKSIVSTVLSALLVASSLLSAYGFNDKTLQKKAVANAESMMVDFGYPDDLLHTMKDDQKLALATQIENDPGSVFVNTVVSPIDELKILEILANHEYSELRSFGLEEEDIAINRQMVDRIQTMTGEELAKCYGRSDEEIKLLKMAVEQQADHQSPEQIEEEDKVTASTIGTSTLKYTWVIYDNRAETKKPVSYFVHIGFQWTKNPMVTVLKDKIAISWGCDLDSMSESCEVVLSGPEQSSNRTAQMEVVPNKGLIFTFWQRAPHGLFFDAISSGYAACTVFQNSRRNLSARIASQYGHGVFTVTGGGVSIGVGEGGAGIDFGFGFRESNQLSSRLSV